MADDVKTDTFLRILTDVKSLVSVMWYENSVFGISNIKSEIVSVPTTRSSAEFRFSI